LALSLSVLRIFSIEGIETGLLIVIMCFFLVRHLIFMEIKALSQNHLFQTLAAASFLLFLNGCAGAPVKIGDGKVEKSLRQVTGLAEDAAEKASRKDVLNLWDVYSLAVKRTEDLANKVENIEQAEAQSQQAVASILPQIFLNGSKGWQSNSYVGSSGSSSFTSSPSTSLYFSGTETILTGLNQVAALQGAQAQVDQNRHLLQLEARGLLLNVARSFYAVLQAQDTLQAKQEIQNLTQQILKQEQQWKAIGRSRDSDVLGAEAELAQLNADLENTQNQLVQARENLAVLAGLKTDQPLKSEETAVPPASSMEKAEMKLEERPDVLAAKAAMDLADAVLLQAHGQHLPSLGVQGNYYLEKEGSSPSPEWNVLLVASLPIFEGGSIVAQERLAASKKRQAEMAYSLIRRQALQDIRQAYQSLTSSLSQVEAYGKALDAAQKNYAAVEKDRKLALNTNLDVLQALTSLQNAQNNYNQARYQALVNWTWFGAATGELPKKTEN
jgi:outer membrane protein